LIGSFIEVARPGKKLKLIGYIVQENGCWDWVGARTNKGYGNLAVEGRFVPAHRYVYEQEVGPIPEGLTLDHLCRNRACVRPDHLEPVTHKENCLRGVSLFAEQARRTHCIRGHPLSGENLELNNIGGGKIGRRCKICRRANARKRWKERSGKR
jgi:hypothetical protein